MPGAGRGAPGCFIPDLASVELDGVHLGQHPATCDPARPSDRDRYPALWGVLVHEAAHARHSAWKPPAHADPAHAQAADLLEESRVEAAHLRWRPADRRWLRAAVSQLILADFTPAPGGPSTPPGTSPRASMTPWDAARAAALLLARAETRILDREETAQLAITVINVLGAGRLSALADLWHQAHAATDDDPETMLDLGRLWCDVVGVDPDRPVPSPEDESAGTSPLADAIAVTLDAVAAADAPPPPRLDQDKTKQRRDERDTRKRAGHTARRVFSPQPGKITRSRPPTPSEQTAARRLARLLRAAAYRERVTTTTTSATPPGRLRMRGALAADAQRAAGATPTAEPFTRTHRRHIPAPPLRIAIACDVSRSMKPLAAPVASAAWILARAASHIPDAHSASVSFGQQVRPITYPGHTPARVAVFTASDYAHEFVDALDALDALDAALDLTRPGAIRLLVIVSDGFFEDHQRQIGQQRITRLTGTGCAVLWLALGTTVAPMNGTHLVTLTDPADAATTIGKAATRALNQT
jgi:hypothetical protein